MESLLTKLDSSKIKDRKDALEEISMMLRSGNQLPQNTWASLLSGLFRNLEIEKQNYIRLQTDSTVDRVENVSNTLRLYVEKYVEYFSANLVTFVVDSCINIVEQGNFLCSPAASGLLRILEIIVKSNVFCFRFKEDNWNKVMTFTTHWLGSHVMPREKQQLFLIMEFLMERDIVGGHCEPVARILVKFFDAEVKESANTRPALRITNMFLIKLHMVSISCAIQVTKSCIRYLTMVLSTRNDLVYEQIILFTIVASDLLDNQLPLLIGNIQGEIDYLKEFDQYMQQYVCLFIAKYNPKSLDLDSISYDSSNKTSWLRFQDMCLKPGHKERPWLTLLGMVKLLNIYFKSSFGSESTAKRQKVLNESLERIVLHCDDFQEFAETLLASNNESLKLLGLQLIGFTASIFEMDNSRIVESVIGVSSLSQTMSNWCDFALIPLLSQEKIELDTYDLVQMIRLKLTTVKYSHTCKLSCQLIATILKYYKIEDPLLQTAIDMIYDISIMNGPAYFCREAFMFWKYLNIYGKSFKSGTKEQSCQKVVEWMKAKVAPFDDSFCDFMIWLLGLQLECTSENSFYNQDVQEDYACWNRFAEQRLWLLNTSTKYKSTRKPLELNSQMTPNHLALNGLFDYLFTAMDTFHNEGRTMELVSIIFQLSAVFDRLFYHKEYAAALNTFKGYTSAFLSTFTLTDKELILQFMDMSNNYKLRNIGSFVKDVMRFGKIYNSYEQLLNSKSSANVYSDFDTVRTNTMNKIVGFTQVDIRKVWNFVSIKSETTIVCTFLKNMHTVYGESDNHIIVFSKLLKYIELLTPEMAIESLFSLMNILEFYNQRHLSGSFMLNMMDLIAKVLLGVMKTSQTTAIILPKFLIAIDWSEKGDMATSCEDFFYWLKEHVPMLCIEARLSWLHSLLHMMEHENSTITKQELFTTFIVEFNRAPHYVKASLANTISRYAGTLSSSKQDSIYAEVLKTMDTESLESASGFSIFLSSFSTVSHNCLVSSVLLLISQNNVLDVERSLRKIRRMFQNYKDIFLLLKYEILLFTKDWEDLSPKLNLYFPEFNEDWEVEPIKRAIKLLSSCRSENAEDISAFSIPLAFTQLGVEYQIFEIIGPMGEMLAIDSQFPQLMLNLINLADISKPIAIVETLTRDHKYAILFSKHDPKLSSSDLILVSFDQFIEIWKQLLFKHVSKLGNKALTGRELSCFIVPRLVLHATKLNAECQFIICLRRIKVAFSIMDCSPEMYSLCIEKLVSKWELFGNNEELQSFISFMLDTTNNKEGLVLLTIKALNTRPFNEKFTNWLSSKLSRYDTNTVLFYAMEVVNDQQVSLTQEVAKSIFYDQKTTQRELKLLAIVMNYCPSLTIIEDRHQALVNYDTLKRAEYLFGGEVAQLWVSHELSNIQLAPSLAKQSDIRFNTKLDIFENLLEVIIQSIVDISQSSDSSIEDYITSNTVLGFLSFKGESLSNETLCPIDFSLLSVLYGVHIKELELMDTVDITKYSKWSLEVSALLISKLFPYSSLMNAFYCLSHHCQQFIDKNLVYLFILFVLHGGHKASTTIANYINHMFMNGEQYEKRIIKVLVDVCYHVRYGTKREVKPLKLTFVRLDFNSVYQNAIYAGRYEFALLMFEKQYTTGSLTMDNEMENLKAIYEGLKEPNLMHGLNLPPSLSLGKEATGWQKMMFYAAELDSSIVFNKTIPDALIQTELNLGLNGLAAATMEYCGNSYSALSDGYDWNWKLGKWDLALPQDLDTMGKAAYSILKSSGHCDQTRRLLRQLLCESKLKDTFPDQWINAIEIGVATELYSDMTAERKDIATRWTTKYLQAPLEDFSLKGDTMTARINLLTSPGQSLLCFKEMERYCLSAIEGGYSQHAMTMVARMHTKLEYETTHYNLLRRFCDVVTARVLNSQGHNPNTPIRILLQYLDNPQFQLPENQTPIENLLEVHEQTIRSLLVEWISEARQDKPDAILEYITHTDWKGQNLNDQCKAFNRFGQFCYSQAIQNEDISRRTKDLQVLTDEFNELAVACKKTNKDERKDITKHLRKMKIQLEADKETLRSMRLNNSKFVKYSMTFFSQILHLCDDFDDHVLDKFCALWFEKFQDDEMNHDLKIENVPSRKLLKWINQMCSKLHTDMTPFQCKLQNSIIRVAQKYPYESLYYLLSLMLYKTSPVVDNAILSRVHASEKVWSQLAGDGNFFSKYLHPIESLGSKVITIASHKVSGSAFLVDSLKDATWWLQELPTLQLPIPSTASTGSSPKIVSVRSKVSLSMSGLSLPKIVTFIMSDGTSKKMLFKFGSDDLRQDAIMQQVFGQVNDILKATSLRIRTYSVVPLGPQAGVIEFVNESISLNDICRSIHKNDQMSFEEARVALKDVQDRSAPRKLKVFNDICQKIPPQLRLFFTTCFLNVDDWFLSRQVYTKGVVTTSIVGHILGLGDRHLNNILIDKMTGEPVHIDFGVAFDQGKLLPIPETVPFRLTRDMVDGFGITGVEGVFRKNCEYVYGVLRKDYSKIMCILNVLQWDPLYSWAVSPAKRIKLQQETQEDNSKSLNIVPHDEEASKALARVKEKLIGNGLSVEATIQVLIQEATDPKNLSLLYTGWSPFY